MSTDKIRQLNDQMRTTLKGHVVVTAGVANLTDAEKVAAVCAMRDFSDFSEENDPHQEHDFGSFKIDGKTFFFKFDYYDKQMDYASPDPANPAVTQRVLTLMLAEEY